MKRIAFYTFFEKNGIVRDYIIFYLKNLRDVADTIVVIVNGIIEKYSKIKIQEVSDYILIRENKGLDFSAWKHAFETLGWDKVLEYNQLILCNCSCYGPIYPFPKIFEEMDKRICDFWGITRHPEIDVFLVPNDKNSKIINHIQSYFITFKANILHSNYFKHWWDSLIESRDYTYEVAYHEIKFTKYFEDSNFISDTYINDSISGGDDTLIYAETLLKNNLPLIKRKIFSEYDYFFSNSIVNEPNLVLEYIKNNTKYNINYILDDIIKSYPMSTVVNSLHLNYILSSKYSNKIKVELKIALICYVYYPDLSDIMINYIKSMPDNSFICIISSREDTLKIYQKKLSTLNNYKLNFRIKENRGRDVSAYLVTAKDVFCNNDIVCCIHDKKSPHTLKKIGEDFLYHCNECVLSTRKYVENIIEKFINNKKLGLIVPPTVYFGPFTTLGNETTCNKSNILQLYKILNINAPYDNHPVAPYGACFWARCSSLKKLFSYNWKFKDFPKEPLPPDGTISHAIERIYPFIAQDEGYYTAWCSPDTYASLYMSNISNVVRQYNKFLFKRFCLANYSDMIQAIQNDTKNIKRKFNVLKYILLKILSKICFGRLKNKYTIKYKEYLSLKNELNISFIMPWH